MRNVWLKQREVVAAVGAAIVLLLGAVQARAADILYSPPPPPPAQAAVMVADLYDPTRWEVRFGGFMHGVGSVEKGSFDINGEVVVGSFFGPNPLGFWSPLIPRLHAGVNGKPDQRPDQRGLRGLLVDHSDHPPFLYRRLP